VTIFISFVYFTLLYLPSFWYGIAIALPSFWYGIAIALPKVATVETRSNKKGAHKRAPKCF